LTCFVALTTLSHYRASVWWRRYTNTVNMMTKRVNVDQPANC